MNAFNRLVMAALAVILLALAVAVLLVVTGALAAGSVAPGGLLADLAHRLTADGTDQAVATAVSAVVALGALVLLWLEIRPPRRSQPFVVSDTEVGRVTVERDGVCRLAEKTATDLREVSACRTSLADGEGDAGVLVRCVLTITAGSVVRDVAGEVQRLVREVIETQAGLKVAAVTARVRIGTTEPPPPARVVE